MTTRMLRLPEVMARTGLSRSTIYSRIPEDIFPAQIQLGGRTVAWVEEDIECRLQARIADSRHEKSGV